MAKMKETSRKISLQEIENGWKVVLDTTKETLSSKAGWVPCKYECKEWSFKNLKEACEFLQKEIKDK